MLGTTDIVGGMSTATDESEFMSIRSSSRSSTGLRSASEESLRSRSIAGSGSVSTDVVRSSSDAVSVSAPISLPGRTARQCRNALRFVHQVNELHAADVDRVVVEQEMLVDAVAVHERPVRASQVLQERIGEHGDDHGVLGRDRGIRQADVVVRAPADRDVVAVELDVAHRAVRKMENELAHDISLGLRFFAR